MCEPSPQAFTGYAGAADLTTARLLPAPPELCALLRASLGPNSLTLTLCADHAAEVRAQADRDAATASASTAASATATASAATAATATASAASASASTASAEAPPSPRAVRGAAGGEAELLLYRTGDLARLLPSAAAGGEASVQVLGRRPPDGSVELVYAFIHSQVHSLLGRRPPDGSLS